MENTTNPTQSNSTTLDPSASPALLIDPAAARLGHKRVTFRIINGQNIPARSEQNNFASNPYVAVCIDGDPSDRQAKATPAVFNSARNPIWNHEVTFVIKVPERAVIIFLVNHLDRFLGNSETVGAYTLPFLSLASGYRNITLQGINGDHISLSKLFVKVTVTDV